MGYRADNDRDELKLLKFRKRELIKELAGLQQEIDNINSFYNRNRSLGVCPVCDQERKPKATKSDDDYDWKNSTGTKFKSREKF